MRGPDDVHTIERQESAAAASSRSRAESAALKRTGLIAMLASAGILSYLSSSIDTTIGAALFVKYSAGAVPLVLFIGLGAIGINLGVAGVLAVVTAARRLSVASRATRRGLAVMWLGADCLVVGLIAGNLVEGHNDVFIEWADAPAALAWVFVAIGILLFRHGWKYDVARAAEVIAADPRPPVVYLRSFQDDVKSPVGGAFGLWIKVPMYFFPSSFEQELAAVMNRLGPFLAVGRPGERLPQLGANRFYFSDDEWQARVAELVNAARLTVILCGPTPNLWWEIDHVLSSASPRRVVLLIPERGTRTRALEAQIEERLQCPGAICGEERPRRSWFATVVLGPDATIGKVVYFADDWTPRVQVIRQTKSVKAYLRMLTRPYSLFGEPLESAFERVFSDLGLPWTAAGPSRLIAIVLALTLGSFGAHHFYLGDRRTGLRYLLFCWTLVPTLLGLRDTVRLILLDRESFEKNYETRFVS